MGKAVLLCVMALAGICGLQEKTEKVVYMTDAFGQVFHVTSELLAPEQGLGRYGAHNLFDGNVKTAWAEGAADSGIKQKIRVVVKKPLTGLKIVNGYARNRSIFRANNRVRKIRIRACAIGMPAVGMVTETRVPVTFSTEICAFSHTLSDSMQSQAVALPDEWLNRTRDQCPYALEIEILSVYPGNRFDDTCVSEVQLISAETRRLEIRNRGSEIWVILGSTEKMAIKSDESVFQLLETSPDKRWAIVIKMAKKAVGRVETVYCLFSVHRGAFIAPRKIGAHVSEMYGFEQKNSRIYLQAFDAEKQTDVLIDLSEVEP